MTSAYSLSKLLAEKAAWDYQKSLPEGERFELTTVNPGLVLGEALVGKGFASGEVITDIMVGKNPGQPRVMFPTVDVKEVAQAHLNAVKIPEAANRRFILVNKSVWMEDIAVALHGEFASQGWPIKTH